MVTIRTIHKSLHSMVGGVVRGEREARLLMIEYARLTWPQVDALPRDTRLYLPVGEACVPAEGVVLPRFPYGSGFEAFPAYIDNLVAGLNEDGFHRVEVLPGDTPLNVDGSRDRVVLIPVGHTEQHGYHLSMQVDTVLIGAIAQAVARRSGALALPVMPYGVSTHRACFRGTLNAGGRNFEDFYLELLEWLYAHGYRRFYLLSGHGGNCSFLVTIVKYFGERRTDAFAATAHLYLGEEAVQRHRSSPRGGMGHAGELETSLMLHLAPDQVFLERVADELDFISTPSYYMDWVEGGALTANPSWYDDTVSGAYGAGSQGTAEKGRLWFELAVEEKLAHVAEIEQQHRRRRERQRSGWGRWA